MVKEKIKPKQGRLSGSQHSDFICQEIVTRKSVSTTLEMRTTVGDVLFTSALAEPSAGHQISPDGRLAYVLTGGQVSEFGILRSLMRIDFAAGTSRQVGISNSALPAVDDRQVAYFSKDALIVETHDGDRILEKSLGALGVVHGSAAHACALLPGSRIAVSRGHRGLEKIADLTIIGIDNADEALTIELPVDTSYSTFVTSALRADPKGKLVAILGFHAGLLIVDLDTGKDVAASFPPDPLDLAEGRPTKHATHAYSDLAFDEAGERLAAAYSPGKLSVWARDGAVLKREWISTNPKASRIVTFDTEGVAFFDSQGAIARLPVGS